MDKTHAKKDHKTDPQKFESAIFHFRKSIVYPDLNGFKGRIDKKMILNGLEANCFHNHFALTITRVAQK
jgi:hypothetical protein